MKGHIFIFALALVAHVVHADWKEEMLNKRYKNLDIFVRGEINALQNMVKHHQKGFHCVDPAVKEFEITSSWAQAEHKFCIYNRWDDKSFAEECCNSVGFLSSAKVFTDYGTAFDCIFE